MAKGRDGLFFKTQANVLAQCLSHAKNVVERRNTIPILANVMLAVREGKLTLTATDMEIAIVEDAPASTTRNGSCTVPAATLYEIVRKLPEGAEVELDHPGGDAQLALRAGRYSTSLVVLPTEDFPSMTAGALPHRFNLSAQVLRGLIDRTRFAISTEGTRYYLNGIYLHAAETEGTRVLRAVATDGHRLARVEEPLPEGAGSMPGVIIPRKTVNELRKLLKNYHGEIDVALSDARIQFQMGPITLTTKVIDGTFPEYERVIPRGNDNVLRVGKKDFADAVGRVAAISAERSCPVKLSLARDLLVLSAASPECGIANETLNGGSVLYKGKELEIGFQARYLRDVLDTCAEDIELSFLDGSSPAIVRDADARALHVLMPMRV